jgi:hypothetical protein
LRATLLLRSSEQNESTFILNPRKKLLMHDHETRRCRFLTLMFLSLLAIPGCGGLANPGTWSEAEIEANIKEKMGLESVDVTPSADGYTGTAKNSEGESFTFTIKQDAASKKLQYTATGDRGTIEEGFFEVD